MKNNENREGKEKTCSKEHSVQNQISEKETKKINQIQREIAKTLKNEVKKN